MSGFNFGILSQCRVLTVEYPMFAVGDCGGGEVRSRLPHAQRPTEKILKPVSRCSIPSCFIYIEKPLGYGTPSKVCTAKLSADEIPSR